MDILMIIIKFLFVPIISPLCIGIIRKIKAFMQNRHGASIFQPYRDLLKLFSKDEVISPNASWIFMFAPYIIFTITLVILGVNDFLTMIYLFTFASFFMALAGIDTASSFGGFGSSREMTVLALSEGGMLFSILPIAILTHSTNMTQMASILSQLSIEQYLPIIIAFVAFFIALLAENNRIPFDNPSTHLELTMIHEAMILEYSGKRLSLIEWASFNKLVIFGLIGTNLFFPWGDSILFVLLKLLLILGLVAIIESTIAKLRYFKLPDLLFTSFVLGVISLCFI